MNIGNQSEVAIIRQQIEEAYQSAQLAMYGYAGVARHEIINAKYERMGELVARLSQHVGKDRAVEVLIGVMEQE